MQIITLLDLFKLIVSSSIAVAIAIIIIGFAIAIARNAQPNNPKDVERVITGLSKLRELADEKSEEKE